MMAKTSRITAVNNAGATASITVSGIGHLVTINHDVAYGTATTVVSGSLGTNPNYLEGSTMDNFISSFQGMDYFDISIDGGSTWPGPGNSKLLYTTPTISSSGTYNFSFSI